MKTNSLPLLRKLQLWLAGLLCSIQLTQADAINIPTPPGSDHVEGDTQVTWQEYGSRFQQVFDASLFKTMIPNGGWIQRVYLKADGRTSQPSFANLKGAEISLSTTTREVNSLSPVFADNIGSDVKVLLSRSQSIDFSGGSIHPDGVRGYGPFLDYAQSAFPPSASTFFYDPSKGNLLMDFKNVIATLGAGSQQLSALTLDGVTSPTMSSVSGGYIPGNPNPFSGTLSSKGLVMLFQVTPVPEPSAFVLGSLGIFGLTLLRRHKNNRTNSHVTV